jgi:hypothetical protein
MLTNSFTLLQVKIYNVLGQEMFSQFFKNNTNTINLDISTLPKGIYNVVTIADSKTIKTTKLLVE